MPDNSKLCGSVWRALGESKAGLYRKPQASYAYLKLHINSSFCLFLPPRLLVPQARSFAEAGPAWQAPWGERSREPSVCCWVGSGLGTCRQRVGTERVTSGWISLKVQDRWRQKVHLGETAIENEEWDCAWQRMRNGQGGGQRGGGRKGRKEEAKAWKWFDWIPTAEDRKFHVLNLNNINHHSLKTVTEFHW